MARKASTNGSVETPMVPNTDKMVKKALDKARVTGRIMFVFLKKVTSDGSPEERLNLTVSADLEQAKPEIRRYLTQGYMPS